MDKVSPWTNEMVKSLDEASTLVVSHLAPPDSKKPIKCKGLVLGYIQSGKTANFSATIAKAVDEGYPKDFLVALDKPKTYYGPEDLFGREAVNGKKAFEGMPVIRRVRH